ncbi:MAG TPA: YpmA family protein [Clostridiales bacterium]|nr:YpmA family protein [Clostridiales bacterium]
MEEGLKILSTITLGYNSELYKIVDFLNKTLKPKNLVFGLAKDGKDMSITVYEVVQ